MRVQQIGQDSIHSTEVLTLLEVLASGVPGAHETDETRDYLERLARANRPIR